jgi:hypothetical protein
VRWLLDVNLLLDLLAIYLPMFDMIQAVQSSA